MPTYCWNSPTGDLVDIISREIKVLLRRAEVQDAVEKLLNRTEQSVTVVVGTKTFVLRRVAA